VRQTAIYWRQSPRHNWVTWVVLPESTPDVLASFAERIRVHLAPKYPSLQVGYLSGPWVYSDPDGGELPRNAAVTLL
jgi:hypothetical protein